MKTSQKKQPPAREGVVELVIDGMMTIPEAMAFLRVSRTTLYKLMDDGLLEWVKYGTKSRRLPRRAVVEFAAKCLHGGWAKPAV
jgi:excisionase family DNA binding protein